MAVLHLANCSVSVTDVHLGWMHRGQTFDCILKTQRQKQRHHWIIWNIYGIQDAQTRLVAASEEVAVVCAVPWRCSQLLPFSRDSWKEQMHAPPLLHDWIDSAELKVGRDRGCSRTDTPTNKMLTVESNYALTEHRS